MTAEEEVEVLARLAGLSIDPAHLPGVVMNLGVLKGQAALLFDQPISALIEPAPVYPA